MANLKLNKAENLELLGTFKLDKKKHPIAFEHKVQELMSEGISTRDEAEKLAESMEIDLEIYYQEGYGLFAVDTEAVESGTIYSPYNGELADNSEM